MNLLADSTNFSGINSNVLTILHAAMNDTGTYRLIVTDNNGMTNSTGLNLFLETPSIIGEWFNGSASLADVSGYTPAGTHDGFIIGNGNYAFTNDVPPGKTGQSMYFFNQTGMAITNTSLSDEHYTNTFDDPIQYAFTVTFWAKGYPGQWSPWVSKGGENGMGWQFRDGGNSANPAFTMRGVGGTVTVGTAVFGNPEDLRGTIAANDGQWHFFVGVYGVATRVRSLYVDGVPAGVGINPKPYTLAPYEHLCISAREPLSGFNFEAFSTFEIYDLRIYNYDHSPALVFINPFPDPYITVQPQSTTAYIGGTMVWSTTVKGTAPFTNHWQFNGTNLVDGFYNGTIVFGSTSNILTLYNLTTNFQGTYGIVVSNSLGTTTSSNAVLTLATTVPAPQGNLVGAWLMGATNLADSSGFRPAGTHDGYGVTGLGIPSSNYTFTNDVPPYVNSGHSLSLNGTLAIAISNSSSLDASYTNTFDDVLNTNGMSITLWAKGLPGAWNPWISKYGENGEGWQIRVNASANTPCWTIRGTGGNEDMSSLLGKIDTNWHFYAGTYSPVTGNRTLYVDGVLAATQAGQGPLTASLASHITIGGRDSGGNNFGNCFNGEIYGVRLFNTELTQAQVNALMGRWILPGPFPMPRILQNGNQLIFQWSFGTLLQATNPTGPWMTNGATSPYTNDVTTNGPFMFYRWSIP